MNRVASPAGARPLNRRILLPIERFLSVEAVSGVLLLAAAAVALIWANSPWAASYERLWHVPLTVGVGRFTSVRPLSFWVNDGLMTVFFLVIGLEIRREIHDGVLSDPKMATLPVVAAMAGVIVPALIYIALNASDPVARRGWAVPTATDIAFAVGVLSLAGKGVPPALRMLLLTLAIIDDIAAILIIAFVYSNGIALSGLLIAGCGILLVLLQQSLGFRRAPAYLLPGALVWLGMLRAGVHPTLAGVILGLMTPVTPSAGRVRPLRAARRALAEITKRIRAGSRDSRALLQPVDQLHRAQREMLSPCLRLQAAFHPWVAYAVMPLFALANAGVSVKSMAVGAGAPLSVGCGIVLGLVLGKPVGIITASVTAVRLGLCALPQGIRWRHLVLLGCLGGIGFTMSIFIANLAFPNPALLSTAKLAVLLASTSAGIVSLVIGRRACGRVQAGEDPERLAAEGRADRKSQAQ